MQPWRVEMFTFCTDPELEAKFRAVVGLYLDPPQNAVVVSVDERSQIQALDRTAPMLPMRPGIGARQTRDDKRNGTTTLFAALQLATGRVTDRCYDRHAHVEFRDFLTLVATTHPGVQLHVVRDNYATHKHSKVKRGWRTTPWSRCTSPRPAAAASTWSESSSASSPASHETRHVHLGEGPHHRHRSVH